MKTNPPRRSFIPKALHRLSHRRIIANTAWLFVDKVICGAIGFVIGAWVARYLGRDSFGLFSYALSFVGLLVPVTSLGLHSIIIRDLVKEPEAKDEILGTALLLRIGASLFVFLTLLCTLSFGFGPREDVLRWLLAVLSVQLLFDALAEPLICWFESQLQSKYVVWARDSSTLLGSLLKGGLVLASAELLAFGAATVIQVVAFVCGTVALFRITGNRFSVLRARVSRARQLLADSWPLIFSGLAIVVYMRIDQIMLGHLVGAEALGEYSAAVRLSELWYFIPAAVTLSLFPGIVRSREHESLEVSGMKMQVLFDTMVTISYVVAILLTLVASPLIIALFGAEYVNAAPILRVHIWALVFVSIGTVRGRWLIAENLVQFQLFSTVSGALVNVGLNILLIPSLGGMGAAWATLLSYAVSAYLSSLLFVPTWGVFRQSTMALFVPLRFVSFWRSFREVTSG